MFLEYHHDGHFEVATGLLEESNGIVQFQGHMWIEDTRDGGGSEWIPTIGSRPAERWLVKPRESTEIPIGWRSQMSPARSVGQDEKLRAHCHCGGVEFFITRPTRKSLDASSPYPDLLVPYHSGLSGNPDNTPWWLSKDGKRYVAGPCTCNSCRLVTGFDVVEWAFVPIANIELPDGKPFQPSFGTLKEYRSSEKVPRRFCGRCGATVFWHGDERPTLIDVAVGLLDADSGSRAEEWLQWSTDRVSFGEDALNKELISSLHSGLAQWGKLQTLGETETCV